MPDEAPLDREEFARWREEAGRALESARREAAAGAHNWSCFLSEQAAQLALKSVLHGLGRGPWGHDLVGLGRAIRAAGLDAPTDVEDRLMRLARHYIPARYPDAHAAGSASSRYSASDSAAALVDAERVIRYVDTTWATLHG